MKKQERRREELSAPWMNVACELLKGGGLAGIVVILSLLLCAVLISSGTLSERWMDGAVLAVCVAGAFAGGMYTVRRLRTRTLLLGLGVGAVLFLLLLTAGLLAYDSASLENGGIGVLCACLCGGGISGVLFRQPKKKRRK